MAERYTNAVVFCGFLEGAARLGLREPLSASSPQLAELFVHPPLPTAMIPGAVCDAFYRAVVSARGRPALRAIALETMRGRGSPVVKRLFESTIALYGKTPEALFGQVALIVSPLISNIDVRWEPHGPRGGTIEIRPAGQPAPLSYAIWEGYLEYFFESCGVRGTVDEVQLAPDGLSGSIAVRW